MITVGFFLCVGLMGGVLGWGAIPPHVWFLALPFFLADVYLETFRKQTMKFSKQVWERFGDDRDGDEWKRGYTRVDD